MAQRNRDVVYRSTLRKLRRQAQIESWAWRFAYHRIRPGWTQHAACRHTATEDWFAEDRTRRHQLLPLCQTCPVRLDCGVDAIRNEERTSGFVHGARAGFGADERLRVGKIYDRLTQSA